MSRKTISLALALCLFFCAATALAGDGSPGAGMSGFSLQTAYEGAYMYYVERRSGSNSILDKDYGWQHGGFIEARYDFEKAFARARFDAMGSNQSTYDGSLMNGTPYKSDTHEFTYKAEADLGYKLYDQDRATFSPYAGVGYRSWRRGENVAPSYVEYYTWWYAALGVNHMFRAGKWMLGYDAAVLLPFSMKMETDMRGRYDKATFNIQPLPGLRLETPVSYEIYRSADGTRVSVTGTPFYEKWDIGKSHAVTMTRGGVSTGASYYEPKSSTDIIGMRLGLAFRF